MADSIHTWNLVQVDTNSMILRVSVEEHAELQEWIWAVFDTWHHAAWRECCLLDVSVEVLGVLVQNHAAEVMHLLVSVPHLHLSREYS